MMKEKGLEVQELKESRMERAQYKWLSMTPLERYAAMAQVDEKDKKTLRRYANACLNILAGQDNW